MLRSRSSRTCGSPRENGIKIPEMDDGTISGGGKVLHTLDVLILPSGVL